jgi:hypothetical protein
VWTISSFSFSNYIKNRFKFLFGMVVLEISSIRLSFYACKVELIVEKLL